MSEIAKIFDSALLTARRNRAAADAARHDFLIERVADDFAERLSLVKREFANGLNLGAYHGLLSRRLRQLANVGQLIDLEPAAEMLSACDGPQLCAALDTLPVRAESLDLVVSGLALQLVDDLPGALVQIRRALKPDGLMLAALLGGDTLTELRDAWLIAEEEITGGASPRVTPFADVRQLGALLQRAGFALPVADTDVVRVTYATPLDLMREVKAFGASNMLAARRRVPVTKRLMLRAAEVYLERHALPDGRIPATFEIITLTGWVPHENQQKPLRPGSAAMRLADALGVKERNAGEAAPVSSKDPAARE